MITSLRVHHMKFNVIINGGEICLAKETVCAETKETGWINK